VRKLNNFLSLSSLQLAHSLFKDTILDEFNHLLFRCDKEEKDISGDKRGAYGLESGVFEYAGLQSIMHHV